MTVLATLKIIIRSWWRNKVFFIISVVSLAIGLACTNLLFTYFVHDYNIESGNQDKERIFCLRQDDPMQEGRKVAFTAAEIPSMLKEKYVEVEDFLRISSPETIYCKEGENIFHDFTFISTDSALSRFFQYQTIIGSLEQALTQPGKIALSETFARKVFGDKDPLGKIFEIKTTTNTKNYEVAAILKVRSQSLLQFDMITGIDENFYGGTTFLKLSANSLPEPLAKKMNQDKVPTLVPGKSQYYVEPLSTIYFVTPESDSLQSITYINQSNAQLLYIGLAAALLVLLIACCNYTNMSLSRILQQLKMIHVEKLMGSRLKDIRLQLFGDAFLTVLIAFCLSLLIINDCLSFFNELLASRLNFHFFFSLQMLPLLLLFALFMAIVPAWYISRKLSRLSFSEYKTLYGGRKKQRFIELLVILQFIISIGLIFATLIANEQINLIKEKANCYENRIEIGSMFSPPAATLKSELKKNVSGIESIALSGGPILNAWVRELSIKQPDGTEKRSFLLMLFSDTDLIKTLDIRQIAGSTPEQIQKEYSHPVLVNESYVRNLVPAGINPIGKYVNEFDQFADTLSIIGGVVKDFPTSSLESEVTPAIINIPTADKMPQANYLHIKLNPDTRNETIRKIAQTWERMNEGETFQYTDLHQQFMKMNMKTLSFARILIGYSLIGLLLTCFGLFGISWYATRQRIREISIRKIHGATPWQIIWLLNKPFCLQVIIAYMLAISVVYWLMLHWREQFVYQAHLSITDFLLPLAIVWGISAVTVCLQGYLLNKTSPIDSIKTE